jgi:hypothetical protein
MLENFLNEGSPPCQAIIEVYDKAYEVAAMLGEFIREHPIFCIAIALGILILLAPAVVHALRFSALGPVEGKCRPSNDLNTANLRSGSFAASWQSIHRESVSSGSFFAT